MESLHQQNYSVVHTHNYAVVESKIINRGTFPAHLYHSFTREFQESAMDSRERIMEMEPDIENMTLNEYLEYEAEKERRSWRNVRGPGGRGYVMKVVVVVKVVAVVLITRGWNLRSPRLVLCGDMVAEKQQDANQSAMKHPELSSPDVFLQAVNGACDLVGCLLVKQTWSMAYSMLSLHLTEQIQGGYKDNVFACLCHMLYCIETSTPYNLAFFILKRMEKTRNKPNELLPYGMLLTRLFKHVVLVSPELAIDHYLSHDQVMHLLAPHYKRKTRSDHGKKRPRDSNASYSSNTLNHPSSILLGLSNGSTRKPDSNLRTSPMRIPRKYAMWHFIGGKACHGIKKTFCHVPNSLGSKMGEADINTLTMEQHLALNRGNQASGVVKPEVGGNVNFEIKSQFMRELREDTFSGNKNDDAHEHVERILDIVSLFNIPGVTHNVVMLRVFPITLTGAAKRWVDKLPPGTINTEICSKRLSFKGIVHHLKQQDSLRKFITSSKKVMRHCTKHGKGLDTMTRQLLDSQGPIPNKTLAQALDAIQTMADHSQKWNDGLTSRKVSNGSSDGITAITSKLDSLGRDMKKLKENVHAIQVGCETCGGAHLNKECPLHEECKAIFANNEEQRDETSSDGTNELHGVSFISDDNVQVSRKTDKGPSEVLPCQLPPKELSPRSFTLPCIIGSLNLYAMANLKASVNTMPKSMFNHLKLTILKETNMLVEMADMMKKSPMRILKNVLVKIDTFLFPSDFMIIDMLCDPNETMILGRPFLATIHARIDVFNR
ncbi:hypothetical protein Tco_0604594 [Tanacetum coccineum]